LPSPDLLDQVPLMAAFIGQFDDHFLKGDPTSISSSVHFSTRFLIGIVSGE
jgi:hypothetical protein